MKYIILPLFLFLFATICTIGYFIVYIMQAVLYFLWDGTITKWNDIVNNKHRFSPIDFKSSPDYKYDANPIITFFRLLNLKSLYW